MDEKKEQWIRGWIKKQSVKLSDISNDVDWWECGAYAYDRYMGVPEQTFEEALKESRK